MSDFSSSPVAVAQTQLSSSPNSTGSGPISSPGSAPASGLTSPEDREKEKEQSQGQTVRNSSSQRYASAGSVSSNSAQTQSPRHRIFKSSGGEKESAKELSVNTNVLSAVGELVGVAPRRTANLVGGVASGGAGFGLINERRGSASSSSATYTSGNLEFVYSLLF